MLKSVDGRPASALQVPPRSSLRNRPCEAPASTGGSVPPDGADDTATEATTASAGKLPFMTAQLPARPSRLIKHAAPTGPLSIPAKSVKPFALGSTPTAAMDWVSRPSACQEPAPSLEE